MGSPVSQSLVLPSQELVADPSGQRGKPKLDETPARPRSSDAKSTVVLEWGLSYVPRASDKSLYSSEPQFPHTSNEGRWEDQTREGDVQTVGATAHFTDSGDTHEKSKRACACAGRSFVLGRLARVSESEPGQGWVDAILPAPTPSTGPALWGFSPAGGGLKAARRALHVRRQHRLRPQRAARATRLAWRSGCPRRWAAESTLSAPGARGPPAALPGPPPPLRAGPAGQRLPSRHPRGVLVPSGSGGRVGRRGRGCASRLARGWLPAPAAPPAAFGGGLAGELGGTVRTARGSGRLRPLGSLCRRPRAAAAAGPAPSRLHACDRLACVCVTGARVCARACGAVCLRGVRGECVCVRVGVSAWLVLAETHTHSLSLSLCLSLSRTNRLARLNLKTPHIPRCPRFLGMPGVLRSGKSYRRPPREGLSGVFFAFLNLEENKLCFFLPSSC